MVKAGFGSAMQLDCCLEMIEFLVAQQPETGEPEKVLECMKVLQRTLRDGLQRQTGGSAAH